MFYLICTILILYIYCIMPRIIKRPDVTRFKECNFAHRGFHDKKQNRPENSIKAFQRAVELGYGIELDVQLTKDNQVVVFHDFNLKRVCGIDKEVRELTYQELKKYRLFDSNESIPLFTQVLSCVDGKVPLLVELKCKDTKDKIALFANQILKSYTGEYYIESFHPYALRWYRKNRPDVIRGQLGEHYGPQSSVGKTIAYFLQQNLLFNFLCRPDFISYNWKNDNNISLNICKYIFQVPLSAWTIRSKDQLEKAKKKFDVMIFEKFHL